MLCKYTHNLSTLFMCTYNTKCNKDINTLSANKSL